jgi:hypothetical protein
VLLGAAAVLASGCGDPRSLNEGGFEHAASTIASNAHESAELARAVELGRSPTRTTLVRIMDLTESIDTAQAAYSPSRTPRNLRSRVKQLDDVSTQTTDLLAQLYEHPDATTARRVHDQLVRLGDRAKRLEHHTGAGTP